MVVMGAAKLKNPTETLYTFLYMRSSGICAAATQGQFFPNTINEDRQNTRTYCGNAPANAVASYTWATRSAAAVDHK